MGYETDNSLEHQVAVLYEQLSSLEHRIEKIEILDPSGMLKVPQYVECDSEPGEIHKVGLIEYPPNTNALFIVNFTRGINIPADKEVFLELKYIDTIESDVPEMKTYVGSNVRNLPTRLNPGAHAMIQCWMDIYPGIFKGEEDVETGERFFECVAITSLGISEKEKMAENQGIEEKLNAIMKRIDALETKINGMKI